LLAACLALDDSDGDPATMDVLDRPAISCVGELLPSGLNCLRIELETESGTYEEPNFWMRHPL
jgi:hypothetical protein